MADKDLFDQKTTLITLLEACPSLLTKGGREKARLELPFRNSVPEAALESTRQGITALVDAAFAYPLGLAKLFKVVAFFDEDTIQLERLAAGLADILPDADLLHIAQPYIEAQLAKLPKGKIIGLSQKPGVKRELSTETEAPNEQLYDWDEDDELFNQIIQREKGHSPQQPKDVNEYLRRPDEHGEVVSVEEWLARHNHITLLGNPGAGKTTTLIRLFRQQAEANSTDRNEQFALPMFVPLNRWQKGLSLEKFIVQIISEFGNECKLFASLVSGLLKAKKGRLLLLLDGLNELPEANYTNGQLDDPRAEAIAKLANNGSKVILSCRINDFKMGVRGVGKWYDLHVLPLSKKEICEFASKCLTSVQAELFINALFREVVISDDISFVGRHNQEVEKERLAKWKEFTTQPFYLSRLLKYYKEYGTIPDNPLDLLKRSVEFAFAKLKIRKPEVDVTTLKNQLALLAFNMTDANQVTTKDYASSVSWLFTLRPSTHWRIIVNDEDQYAELKPTDEQLKYADKLKDWGEAAYLIESLPSGSIRFAHQLLQEYFAALYCLNNAFTENLFERIFFVFNFQFREVRNFWFAMADPFDQARAILEFPTHYSAIQRKNAVEVASGSSNRPEAVGLIPMLKPRLQDENVFVRTSATQAASEYAQYSEAVILIRFLIVNLRDKESEIIRANAADALAKYVHYPESVSAIAPLIKALEDEKEIVRQSAVNALAEYAYRPETVAAIEPLTKLLQDKNIFVRQNTARTLANYAHYQSARKLIQPLIMCLEDNDIFVKRNIVKTLGAYNCYPEIGVAIDPLITLIQNTLDTELCCFTIIILAHLRAEKALPYLQELTNDSRAVKIFDLDTNNLDKTIGGVARWAIGQIEQK
jgi:HEAT repeat protein